MFDDADDDQLMDGYNQIRFDYSSSSTTTTNAAVVVDLVSSISAVIRFVDTELIRILHSQKHALKIKQ